MLQGPSLRSFLLPNIAMEAQSLEGGSNESIGDEAIFGVVTVSDRASVGIYDDLSGPAILNFFREAIKSK